MLNSLSDEVGLTTCEKTRKPLAGLAGVGRAAVCALAMLAAAVGCKTTAPGSTTASSRRADAAKGSHTNSPAPPLDVPSQQAAGALPAATNNASTNSIKSLVLQEGDTIKITFPGAPNLDTTQAIRRDGKISLEMIGEYDAAGKTPVAMEADLKKLYASQIVNSEVSVTVQSSAFVVYVMGAVSKPGKVISERPLNVLEALIEAGVDNSKSNLKAVQILHTDSSGGTQKTTLNLYKYLHKKKEPMPSFTLRPYDIINVPERFTFY